MPTSSKVHVIHRNARWEVSTSGLTRPMIDWLCTRERAIAHALERAREIEEPTVVVENADGFAEEEIPVPRGSTAAA